MPYFEHDGQRLFYREQGSGPLLLILPGNTASSAHHEADLAHFSARYRAVALDFRGTGQSDRLSAWPADWWEQGACDAAALIAHLEHTGAERALVVGTSGGGMAALLMAIRFPGRVQAVIADSCVERLAPERLRAEAQERERRTPEQVGFWQHAHGDDWEQVVDADTGLLLQLAEQGGDVFRGRLSQVRCPVLLSASLRDPLLPEVGAQVCRMTLQIPGSRVFLSSEGEHPLMWSRSGDFRRAAACFLDAVQGGGPSLGSGTGVG